ncbi:MAG: HAMP domain-containing sensor histidine kinase [Clostridia bacterium]|nr:HAMP domain-containing sensor histidine kinase [Clostridia bacterium]
MKKALRTTDSRIRMKLFPFTSFLACFGAMVVLTTVQMKILSVYFDLSHVPAETVAGVILYWLIASVLFTLVTTWQYNRRFGNPMMQFAEATGKVAKGDFSVYVPIRHRPDRMDALDAIITDFNTMVEELGSIETLKTDFISNVSHELKTPIAVISNYASMLMAEDLPDAQRREYAQIVMQSARRLADLISNILKLNKMESQRIVPQPVSYNLCRQLCDCILQFENLLDEKRIELDVDIEDSATISADPDLMALVWNNLFSNALKFTQAGGKITLRQTSDEKEIVVTVSDTGCGMSEETLSHIFDKFYQGDTSHATEGNGLGLALALRVLELSGGTIAVKSALGQGSTFIVRLPVSIEGEIAHE